MSVKIAILISGRGSNMRAIHRHGLEGNIRTQIAFVGSDRADAEGLDYARQHQLPTVTLPYENGRAQAEALLLENLHDVSLLCLAGFMKILSKQFIDSAPCRIVNIHPSVLPDFKGLDTHARVLQAGATHHGCTVHEVTSALDSGEILAQRIIPVPANISEAELAAAVLIHEHQLYPRTIARLIESG